MGLNYRAPDIASEGLPPQSLTDKGFTKLTAINVADMRHNAKRNQQ